MTTNNKALAVIGNYNAADDFADMRQSDVIMPRLAIQQFTSPGVQDGKFVAGQLVDTSSQTIMLPFKTKTKILPVMFWLEWIEWNPDTNCPKDKRVISRSADPSSELAKRAERYEEVVRPDGKKAFAVTEYYNFIVMLPEITQNFTDMFMYGFSRGSHRIGKTWLNRMKKMVHTIDGQRIQAPMWSTLWDYDVMIETKGANKFMVPNIGSGEMLPADYWPDISALATELRQKRADIIERNATHADHDAPTAAPVNSEL